MTSRGAKLAMATAAVLIASAGVALATTQPTLRYTPPTILVKDHALHNSVEDVTVRRDDADFTFAVPSGFAIDPASDDGCEPVAGAVRCKRKGVEEIRILLGNMDDSVSIKLGDSAGKVKQIIRGQEDNDDLFGGPGTQKLVGGSGDDEIYGEAGRDKLIGGPGTDICVGSAQDDTFRRCETIVTR